MLQVVDRKTKSLLDLANFLEALNPALYDQTTYYNPRTGARCICGWHNARTGHAEDDRDHVSASLGLSDTIAGRLFRGPAGQKMMQRRWILPDIIEKPTPKEAAACQASCGDRRAPHGLVGATSCPLIA